MQSATEPTLGTPVGGYDILTGRSSGRHRWRWLWTLLLGVGLWILCIAVTAITRNSNLIPADILIGSFMVPVAAVAWNFDHRADSYLPMTRIFYAFVVGGTIGVLLAALLEAPLARVPAPYQFVFVALIEEAAKLIALILVAQRLRRYTTTDGLVLGATVGFGFAALESSGYAFNALLTQRGLSLTGLIESVILRGLLAPLGHGLWTAVLGMFLFHAAERRNRLRISGALVGMYFAMVALHFLWDSSGALAVVVTHAVLPGVALAIFFDLVVGAVGLGVLILSWNRLVGRWRRRPQQASASGYQAGAGPPWQQPPVTWPPPSPPPPGYRPGPVAPPPPHWQHRAAAHGPEQAPPGAGPQQPGPGYGQQPPPAPGHGPSGQPPDSGRP